MYSIQELEQRLLETQADFELIKQENPIHSVQDASAYYDIAKAAPTFILENENGLLACIASVNRGKLDLKAIKKQLGCPKLNMADRKTIESQTGCRVGAIPLIGHNLPCIFDNALLRYDYIYGGTGEECTTLKINPNDVKRLNSIIASLP